MENDVLNEMISLLKANSGYKPLSWSEKEEKGWVVGSEPVVKGDDIILKGTKKDILSKSAKSFLKFSTGKGFYNLPDGTAITVHWIKKNPAYTEAMEKLQQTRLPG